MMIPADPKWCSYCIKPEQSGNKPGEPCPAHRGEDGRPREHEGFDAYKPSDWVLSVVGKRFQSLFGTCVCFGYDPRHGFWVRDERSGEERNVSERAIGKTLHEIRD